MRGDMHVFHWVRAISKRPEHRVGVGRIDVLAQRNADLPTIGEQRRGPVQAPPDFGTRGSLRVLHEENLAQVGKRLMHDHPANLLEAQMLPQMREEQWFHRDLLEHARFARRYLADDRSEHG